MRAKFDHHMIKKQSVGDKIILKCFYREGFAPEILKKMDSYMFLGKNQELSFLHSDKD